MSRRKRQLAKKRKAVLLVSKMSEKEMEERRREPCMFGAENPLLVHFDVAYICSRYSAPSPCCPMHAHPGDKCCTFIGMAEKKTKPSVSSLKEIADLRKRSSMEKCAQGNCLGVPNYKCSQDREMYCLTHSHATDLGCCRWFFRKEDTFQGKSRTTDDREEKVIKEQRECARCKTKATYWCNKKKKPYCGSHAHGFECCSFSDTYHDTSSYTEEVEEISSTYSCEKRGCDSTEANWWCDRKSKWLCEKCHHDGKECCASYEDEGDEKGEPLKEVKFATID